MGLLAQQIIHKFLINKGLGHLVPYFYIHAHYQDEKVALVKVYVSWDKVFRF